MSSLTCGNNCSHPTSEHFQNSLVLVFLVWFSVGFFSIFLFKIRLKIIETIEKFGEDSFGNWVIFAGVVAFSKTSSGGFGAVHPVLKFQGLLRSAPLYYIILVLVSFINLGIYMRKVTEMNAPVGEFFVKTTLETSEDENYTRNE
jgi:hypothetical protein